MNLLPKLILISKINTLSGILKTIKSGNNFDIIYGCNLSQVVPIDREFQEYPYLFRVQVKGEMINFKVSETGYILTGKSDSRCFSEYWDFELRFEKKLSLVNITQIKI